MIDNKPRDQVNSLVVPCTVELSHVIHAFGGFITVQLEMLVGPCTVESSHVIHAFGGFVTVQLEMLVGACIWCSRREILNVVSWRFGLK